MEKWTKTFGPKPKKVILFGNISNSQSIEPDVFVQSTVNRASEALNSKYSKEEKIDKIINNNPFLEDEGLKKGQELKIIYRLKDCVEDSIINTNDSLLTELLINNNVRKRVTERK